MTRAAPHSASPFVVIDDARSPGGAVLFEHPIDIIRCTRPEDVEGCFTAIERARAEGHYVAGHMAYELGYALERKLTAQMPENRDTPLLWMGVFAAPKLLDQDAYERWKTEGYQLSTPHPRLNRETYIAQIERIREHIRNGDVYQINHTFPLDFSFSGSPRALFAALRDRQRARYSALIDTGERHILSLSPELFIETKSGRAHTRPMKGTAPRHANPLRDMGQQEWLQHDEKSRAENLMIVDLLRNDLSRIATVGTVEVTDLFSVETYPTLHQMTSGIEADLPTGVTFGEIARALFPCGSVTGAPKLKAMEIIRTLEPAPRGVYTGAIGYGAPNGDIRFNVAIRTLDIQGTEGRMGIGSGIVYDSDPAAEWDECHLKAAFVTAQAAPFALLETLKWTRQDGFTLLDRHLERLNKSAAYFCWPFERDTAMNALNRAVEEQGENALRLRLLWHADGAASVETTPLDETAQAQGWRYGFAEPRIDRDSVFVYHKTTSRAFYDDERTRQQGLNGCDEVIFLNDQDEVCEGSFTNVFAEIDGRLVTPPLSCGLLNGTLRQELIETGQAQERRLTRTDLENADAVYLGNSVRGLVRAQAIK